MKLVKASYEIISPINGEEILKQIELAARTCYQSEGKIEYELDLRGKYPTEIEDIIEKFIFDSINSGLKEASIIHGKGSGRLRTEVHKLLRKHKAVKAFRLGNWNEGDSGVTIIDL